MREVVSIVLVQEYPALLLLLPLALVNHLNLLPGRALMAWLEMPSMLQVMSQWVGSMKLPLQLSVEPVAEGSKTRVKPSHNECKMKEISLNLCNHGMSNVSTPPPTAPTNFCSVSCLLGTALATCPDPSCHEAIKHLLSELVQLAQCERPLGGHLSDMTSHPVMHPMLAPV